MLKKMLLILSVISLSWLTSCASVKVPDVPICTQLDLHRGYCIHTISSKEFEINEEKKFLGKTWWELRPYMIKIPNSSWAAIKKFVIKICKRSKVICDNKTVSKWKRTVRIIDEKIAE